MGQKQELQFEIQCLKTLIAANEIQPTQKITPIITVARAHLKVLSSDLKQLNSKVPLLDIDGLTFEERVELHLESARAFIESVIRGLNGR